MKEDNGTKKILLSVLGVAILLVALIGVSFAAFNFTKSGDTNSISTGTITMSYSESKSGINLEEAMPISDTTGVALTGTGNEFKFSVSANSSGSLTIPYTIVATPDAGNSLENSKVKVYLTKDDQAVVEPTKVSALTDYAGAQGSKVLYQTSVKTSGTAVTNNYVLKMWVASDAVVSSDAGYTYKLLVNVYSTVDSLR